MRSLTYPKVCMVCMVRVPRVWDGDVGSQEGSWGRDVELNTRGYLRSRSEVVCRYFYDTANTHPVFVSPRGEAIVDHGGEPRHPSNEATRRRVPDLPHRVQDLLLPLFQHYTVPLEAFLALAEARKRVVEGELGPGT